MSCYPSSLASGSQTLAEAPLTLVPLTLVPHSLHGDFIAPQTWIFFIFIFLIFFIYIFFILFKIPSKEIKYYPLKYIYNWVILFLPL